MATKTDETKTTDIVAKPEPAIRVTTKVQGQLEKMKDRGLSLPANYNAANALNSAWLILQEVQNLDKKPIIANGQLTGVVTELSIVNALQDMVIQGLNPAKKQCYFIVYGQKVVCQRSYFGDMAVAQHVRPGIEFYYDTIHEGEDIAVEKMRTGIGMVTVVSKHVQAFPRTDKPIVGAYCGIVDEKGNDLGADVFDMARIRKSWNMSKNGGKVSGEFPSDMALRTVIRHRCKSIINSSNDQTLLESITRQEVEAVDAEVMEEAAEHANAEALPEPSKTVSEETGEVNEEPKELF